VSRQRDVLVLAARRTPIGRYGGVFKDVPAPHLLAPAIQKIMEDTGAASSHIGEVRAGHVLDRYLDFYKNTPPSWRVFVWLK